VPSIGGSQARRDDDSGGRESGERESGERESGDR